MRAVLYNFRVRQRGIQIVFRCEDLIFRVEYLRTTVPLFTDTHGVRKGHSSENASEMPIMSTRETSRQSSDLGGPDFEGSGTSL